MNLCRQELAQAILSLEGIDKDQLLADWRWLVPASLCPQLLTAFGDWILMSEAGEIHFLDLLEGTLTCIAPSESEFNRLLEQAENRNRWFTADWVSICYRQGLLPKAGECFGWKVHPVFGGAFDLSNLQLFYLSVYESVVGQLFRQLKRHPYVFTATEMQLGEPPK